MGVIFLAIRKRKNRWANLPNPGMFKVNYSDQVKTGVFNMLWLYIVNNRILNYFYLCTMYIQRQNKYKFQIVSNKLRTFVLYPLKYSQYKILSNTNSYSNQIPFFWDKHDKNKDTKMLIIREKVYVK